MCVFINLSKVWTFVRVKYLILKMVLSTVRMNDSLAPCLGGSCSLLLKAVRIRSRRRRLTRNPIFRPEHRNCPPGRRRLVECTSRSLPKGPVSTARRSALDWSTKKKKIYNYC